MGISLIIDLGAFSLLENGIFSIILKEVRHALFRRKPSQPREKRDFMAGTESKKAVEKITSVDPAKKKPVPKAASKTAKLNVLPTFSTAFLMTKFGDIPTYTFSMKVRDVVTISYVAVRGKDDEVGAVQRPLSIRRINDIKSYIMDGNTFFNSFILNWTDENYSPAFAASAVIKIPLQTAAAQVIDGQHRLAGLEQAMEADPAIGDRDILVTLCVGLTTKQAARIFLNINTEQRPVPKSLIFDLFGEVIDDENHATNRATDLARELNDDPTSPLYKLLKFPGSPRGQGYIELSTFVASIKDHLKPPTGTFYTYKLKTLDTQRQAVWNFFRCIRDYYSNAKIWDGNKNPFIKAAGFNGAMDFFFDSLIKRCAEKGSFSIKTMKDFISLDTEGLITWDQLQGQDGKTARKKIRDLLESNLLNSLPDQEHYEF
ncbi:DGQHR domain-containing protein [Massilia sp. DJPM01]|uniref:DGQHR domain-containing protein n=1 Tax=Massilia sp. DJPM01 TaxID=3024404 RepID=UPI00259E84CF|nr:DGQHR domain-containing protein [Massilia sp. DJPM01]MDM5176729.1 DGQHR domain-containing protein [Massilia sp. DJPM01]